MTTLAAPPVALSAVPLSDAVEVTLQRTLRIPDDDRDYPLPPGLGPMPVYPVSALRGLPAAWRQGGGFVVPVHLCEALWLSFGAPFWRPHALKVGVGEVDAISGEAWDPGSLSGSEQDYLVVPDQPWLDGINAGDGFIRQFVTVPLGDGLSVEAQLTGTESEDALRLSLFAPVPGAFPDRPPPPPMARYAGPVDAAACCAGAPMGLGAGGRMRQEIFADEYGLQTWRREAAASVRVRLLEAHDFAALTGLPVPPTPVDAQTYTAHGYPWFELWDPRRSGIAAPERLARVRSIATLLEAEDPSVDVPDDQRVALANGARAGLGAE